MPARPRNNRTPDGAKKRWTSDERARRSGTDGPRTARTASEGSRAARRDARFGQSDAPRQDRRPDWQPGPRTSGRDGDARGASRGDRFGRRDERPARPDRFDRANGGGRSDRFADRDDRRPSWNRDERPQRADRDDRRPSWNRDERPQRAARDDRSPSWNCDERPQRGDRFERPARPDRDEPRSDRFGRRDERSDRGPSRGDRRPERPARTDEPRARRTPDSRPHRDDDRRPRFDDRRPVRGRDDRGSRPTDDAPRWVPQDDVVLERLEAEVVTADDVAGSSFGELGLGQQITRVLADLGATSPFPIQAATIPVALTGRNVLGRGRTGSGKTIAFGAALVERLMRNWAESGRSGTGRRMGRAPRALILAPTRELALQIDRTVQPIARAVGLFTTQIVGGVPQARQVGALAKGVDIVIGTPGRIEDLLEQRRLDLSEVEIAVLDEADHMADLGFLEPIQRLLRRVPVDGQRLLFSATLDTAVAALVDEFLPDPAVHEVADAEGSGTADHRVLVIEQSEKLAVLTALINGSERSLVFARTRAFAEQLADDLDGEGIRAESLHGDLNQARRTRNLARFSEGKVGALVATDVAARGIHVDDIELVVHADAAEDYKTYLHRSGRTGRAGASGTVVTLINPRRRRRMTELLERAGVEAEFVVLHPGDDPVAAIRR